MKTALLCLILFTMGQATQANDSYLKVESKGYTLTRSEAIEANFTADNKREQEVLDAWRMWFKEWGIDNPSPKRTKNYRNYARYIVKWVDYYENNDGNFGGRLIPYKDNHILVAVIIQHETGIYAGQVGKLGEVGLMQVWGDALDGHKRREVKNNPELGIRLGIQWLAYSTTLCKKPKKHGPRSWLKPLTQYGAGPKAKTSGRCEVYRFARKRIRKVIRYRKRMNRMRLASL